jgi:hypothetical protein
MKQRPIPKSTYKSRRELVIDELNGNSKRVSEIGAVGGLSALIFLTMILIIVDVFSEWIDSKGQIIGFIMVMVGLACFSYWALIGRKK